MADSTRRIPVAGHPGIYMKGNRYVVRFRHHGTLHSKSFRTLSEANRFRGKVLSGDSAPTSREPFQTYAKRWLGIYTGRTARGVSDGTRASYRDAVERFAIPFFKTTPLERIDPPALRRYIEHLAKRGLAPNSVRRAYAPVRAMLATAFEDGQLKTNPAAGVRVIVKDTRLRQPKWLSNDETKALLAAMPEEHADLAYFLAATGARISEALSAIWADIDGGDGTVRQSKTEAGLRTIPLSAETLRRLTKRRSQSPYAAPGEPIFPTTTGTPIDPRNWRRRVFNVAAIKAEVPHASPHKLRHGLASLMANRGYSAAQIAAHLGHADGGQLALKTYIHPNQLESADFVDAALS